MRRSAPFSLPRSSSATTTGDPIVSAETSTPRGVWADEIAAQRAFQLAEIDLGDDDR